ncbi:helix-turn-helix domain-containing protein [Paenibacillus sp. 1781tsa1]|uniref:winged helix-turn-helix transcriptional regulator n=1 Tax=Paenibacillus sp. 1781tsa1 TaxID=2953810 RepID=UPI0020A0A1B6|nr:helix-turn-helix domain-containing protein [Paenibacillus sp. 1781tsa1]MCP1184662.1 helix-turn-helix transcriptional regulator [Paenibacillus sp. 1781tsa1]
MTRTLEVSHNLVLKDQARRFHEIRSFLNDIPQGSLTKQLRELEENGLITREVFPEVPPRVEYALSEIGRDFLPILDMMEKFGLKHREIKETHATDPTEKKIMIIRCNET